MSEVNLQQLMQESMRGNTSDGVADEERGQVKIIVEMLKNMSKQASGRDEESKRIEYYMKLAEDDSEDHEEVVPPINFT
jgi:hypothetical protein